MSKVLNLNLLGDELKSFINISASVDSGTLTESTSIDKLTNRNIADAYIFTPSANTTLTISISASQVDKFKAIGVLGSTLTDFTLEKGFSSPTDTITINDTIQRKRSSIGQDPLGSYKQKYDSLAFFDEQSTLGFFYLNFTVSAGVEYTIGSIWGSSYLEAGIAPTSVQFTAKDTTMSDYSNGGQKYVSTGNIINTIKFNIPVLNQTQAKGDEISIEFINNTSGTAIPLIIIPYLNDNMLLYGTQKHLAKLTPLPSNEGNTEWKYKASMTLEEEL